MKAREIERVKAREREEGLEREMEKVKASGRERERERERESGIAEGTVHIAS